MKKPLPLLLALLSVWLAVPASAGTGPTSSPPTNVVRTTTPLPDGGPPVWYVDVRGNDFNTCTAPFTDGGSNGPCLTPQGATNKIPKMLMHLARVSIDAGTYKGVIATGFTGDNGAQQDNGGLLFDGVLVTSTLASGPATGTATSGTAGSGSTFGTLTLTGANWTVNDLVGRFVTTASPTNAPFVVSSNTIDTITVVGTWSAPTASTTFTIQDPGTIFNVDVDLPAAGSLNPKTVGRAGSLVFNNGMSWRTGAISFQNIRFAGTNSAFEVIDDTSVQLTNVQLRPTSSTAEGVRLQSLTANLGGRVALTRCDVSMNTVNNGINAAGGSFSFSNTLIRNAQVGLNAAVGLGGSNGSWSRMTSFASSETRGFLGGIRIFTGNSSGASIANPSNSRIACGNAATGVGIEVGIGSVATDRFGAPASLGTVTVTDVSSCNIAVRVVGTATVDIASMSGSVTTTGIAAHLGGAVSYSKSGTTLTAGVNEVNIEGGEVTGTFAAGVVNQCRVSSTSGNYSRVCAR